MDRLVVDFGSDGRMAVSLQVDGAPIGERTDPVAWADPLDDAALEDVRWYLEDYLRAPFAVYEERGQKVHDSLKKLGQALFASVFGAGAARETYLEARARGEVGELVVRSADPAILGLPWELTWDLALAAPLALSGVALTRMLPSQAPGSRFRADGEHLRVLMVIARPDGENDVGYQMVARRVLPLLAGLRGSVDLTVLRPPTLRRFEQVVEAASADGAPFQVVHFDGHGAFTAVPATGGTVIPDPLRFAAARRGVLSFENEQGGAEYVSAERIGQVLAAGRVPLVVLNACQSGQVGAELEAGIATRLLSGGAVSVVAMAYSVYAVAAAEFMAVFYERLFAGDTVTRAVATARRHMAVENKRPSAKGQLELADWMIPVHYARTGLSFPSLRSQTAPAGDSPLAAIMQQVRDSVAAALPAGDAARVDRDLAAFGGVFVGRDGPLYTLDTAARLQHVVVVHGPGGTGKTELAKAFARWWRDTGGVEQPGWIVWHSFEPGIASFGLDGAVTAAGLQLVGPNFALLDAEQRRETLLQILERHRVLLIWDNFESAVTMPDPTGATPALDEAEQAQITAFLDRIRDRATGAVVITSRTPEAWLGQATRRIAIGGLNRADSAEYTDLLLAPYPTARAHRRKKPFQDLLIWLDGHPLSMRLTLPQLENTDPETLLNNLRGLTPASDPNPPPTDRHASLAASIATSMRHLSAEQQDALTVLSLLHGVADEDVLAWFSEHDEAPAQFRGLGAQEWHNILERTTELGLLEPIGAGMYVIHPALPAYLSAHWQARHPADFAQQRTRAGTALLLAHAALGKWLTKNLRGADVHTAVAILDWQRRNLGAQLGYAINHARWRQAGDIAEPLVRYWDLRGQYTEATAWTARARTLLEDADGTAPDLGTTEGQLWQFLVGAEAARRTQNGLYDEAESTYLAILAAQLRRDGQDQDRANIAVTYNQLGGIALAQGSLDEAESWYRKSLEIDDEPDNRAGVYHQFGMVAHDRGRLDEAENWYLQSLTIKEDLGDRHGVTTTYHQLGMVAHDRGRLDEAENWYLQSLAIKEELGNRIGAANTYHQLGSLMQDQNRLDEAETWLHQALALAEELGNRLSAAGVYHQLGVVARERGRLDESESWYRQSLVLSEELDDSFNAATTCLHIGALMQQRDQLDQAESWYRKALALGEERISRLAIAAVYCQLGSLATRRDQLEEAESHYRKALEIYEDMQLLDRIGATHAQLGLVIFERGDTRQALIEILLCISSVAEPSHAPASTEPADLLNWAAAVGIDAIAEAWQMITDTPLPEAIREYATNPAPDPAPDPDEQGDSDV